MAAEPTPLKMGLSVLAYSVCSSTMLLANKLAMHHLPRPALVSSIQLVTATIAVLAFKHSGCFSVDDLVWSKAKPYMLYVIGFCAGIYCNMQALKASNVETVIVFRALVPLLTSVVDYTHMNRELPNRRSLASLVVIAGGALVYCMCDSQVQMAGLGVYGWVSAYLLLITFEMTYGKWMVSEVNMEHVWGSVLYTNLLAFTPMTALAYSTGDIDARALYELSTLSVKGMSVLLFSCVTGTMIGYTGWLCRGMLTSTSFSLVGVVNKFLTILLNVLLWDKHSTWTGLAGVCVCLLSGMFYQQAPPREAPKPKDMEQGVPMLDKDPKGRKPARALAPPADALIGQASEMSRHD